MKGRFSDINLVAEATASAPIGGWAIGLPIANLLSDQDPVKAPARCLAAVDLALSRFELTWPQPITPSQFGLYFHTLSLDARLRLTGSSLADAAYAAPTLSTGWRWVYPSIYDPTELEFGADNVFAGTVTAGEADLLKRHLTLPIEAALIQRLRVEIDDQTHPLGWFDLGFAHACAAFSPTINFDRGRALDLVGRDQVDKAPSGRRFVDPRPAQRVLSLTFSHLSDPEVRRLVDAGLRARQAGTVIFAPDLDDASGAMREAWPATFEKLPSARFGWPGLGSVAFTLEERLA
jgi:hypothetical protein